jgi:hypothetical protein
MITAVKTSNLNSITLFGAGAHEVRMALKPVPELLKLNFPYMHESFSEAAATFRYLNCLCVRRAETAALCWPAGRQDVRLVVLLIISIFAYVMSNSLMSTSYGVELL